MARFNPTYGLEIEEYLSPGYHDDVNRFKENFGNDELALEVYLDYLTRKRKQ
jgi:Zn-dependent oligopeptidase